MEKDDEVSGEGNSYTAEYWQYDARLGRRWNTDPVVKVHESPYAAFANNPILFIDPSGADTLKINGANNSQWTIFYGEGSETHEISIADYLGEDYKEYNIDIGHQFFDYGFNTPDVLGLDINLGGNLSSLKGEVGLNFTWHTRGEGEDWLEPDIYFYVGYGGSISKGSLTDFGKVLARMNGANESSAGISVSVLWGNYEKHLANGNVIKGSGKDLTNSESWTGYFWTQSYGVPVYGPWGAVYGNFTSDNPFDGSDDNNFHWRGHSIGVSFALGQASKMPKLKLTNFKELKNGFSAEFTEQYYWLIHASDDKPDFVDDVLQWWRGNVSYPSYSYP